MTWASRLRVLPSSDLLTPHLVGLLATSSNFSMIERDVYRTLVEDNSLSWKSWSLLLSSINEQQISLSKQSVSVVVNSSCGLGRLSDTAVL